MTLSRHDSAAITGNVHRRLAGHSGILLLASLRAGQLVKTVGFRPDHRCSGTSPSNGRPSSPGRQTLSRLDTPSVNPNGFLPSWLLRPVYGWTGLARDTSRNPKNVQDLAIRQAQRTKGSYSSLSAVIGDTRAAATDGSKVAPSTTAVITTTAPPKTAGSSGATPKRSVARARRAPQTPSAPTATPARRSVAPRRKNCPRTRPREAPSARRSAISRRRWAAA